DAERVKGSQASSSDFILNANHGFEQGSKFWTASGGTFTVYNSSVAEVGNQLLSASWDASSSSQALTGQAATPPKILSDGGNKICTLSFRYKGGDANLKAQVWDGSAVVAEKDLEEATEWRKDIILFNC